MSECGESGEIHFFLFDDDDVDDDDDDDDARKNVGWGWGGGVVWWMYIFFQVNIELSMQCRATYLSSPLLTRCVFFLRFPLSPNIYNI